MKAPAKLSSDDRRAAIIKAVRHVFADKGFDGTTTRELADAAGISEGLLFKHFPSKEALFTAMQTACCTEEDIGIFQRIKALEPSFWSRGSSAGAGRATATRRYSIA
jgi:AcrR family transcriptional regulator